MNPRPAVQRESALRAVLHLLAVLSVVAALGVTAAPTATAAAARSKTKSASASHRANVAKVDINTATLSELEDLPGVGTVMAQRIMAGRPYKSVQDLKHAGIPPNTIKGLLGRVKAGRTPAARSEPTHRAAASSNRSPWHNAPDVEVTRTNPDARPAARPEAHKSAAPVAAPAKKSAPPRTFFGIPLGGPATPAPKAIPAEGGKQREEPIGAPRATVAERPAPEEAPADGMVWVNLDTKIYHYKGDRWYGSTKHGKYMWEDQAIREGCRAAMKGGKPAGN